MDLPSFRAIVEQAKRDNPFWFDDQPDALGTDAAFRAVERRLSTLLPKKYKEFLAEYGGGNFAFTNIFSVDSDGDWNILARNKEASPYLPRDFLAISDDETGGLFGFLIHEGQCSEGIYYWDHDSRAISELIYEDIFEYIVAVGLSH